MPIKLISSLFIIAILITACGGSDDGTTSSKGISEEDKKVVVDIMKEEKITVEPQVTFDQSQLNNKLLGLCVKFKILDGSDRKDVFDKLETILPSCPIELLADNEANPDLDNAVQIMSFNDLKELLGEPNEMREDGLIVYNLLADKSQRVLFLANETGAISCRFYEGDS